jgi:hypothetical protein
MGKEHDSKSNLGDRGRVEPLTTPADEASLLNLIRNLLTALSKLDPDYLTHLDDHGFSESELTITVMGGRVPTRHKQLPRPSSSSNGAHQVVNENGARTQHTHLQILTVEEQQISSLTEISNILRGILHMVTAPSETEQPREPRSAPTQHRATPMPRIIAHQNKSKTH